MSALTIQDFETIELHFGDTEPSNEQLPEVDFDRESGDEEELEVDDAEFYGNKLWLLDRFPRYEEVE